MTVSYVCVFVCFFCILSVQVKGDGHGISLECKKGWSLYNGYCYMVVEKPMTHENAMTVCNSMSGDLWYGEVDYYAYLYQNITQRIWLGLYRDGSVYKNNDEVINIQTVPSWVNYQPDTASGMCVSCDEEGLTFDDCDREYQFVCWYPACVQGFQRCSMEKKCVHRDEDACDGNNDCQDMSDEINCPQKCRNYVYLEKSAGTFSTPLISPYTDCMWYLEARVKDTIKLTVPGSNLNNAVLEVSSYNLITREKSLKAMLTGQVTRQNIYTDLNSNILMLRVYSNGLSGTVQGLTFSWTTDIPEISGDERLRAESTFKSLPIPASAPDSYEIHWDIRGKPKEVIAFNLESSNGSPVTRIPFSYREASSDQYTVMEMNTYYFTGSNTLRVRLQMDTDKDKNVFLQYKLGCSLTIQASDGKILSPGYQVNSIPHNLTCDWSLNHGSNQPSSPGMSVKFTELDLVADPRDSSKADIIQVYANEDADPVAPNINEVIAGAKPRIHFASDLYLSSKAFAFYFGTDCPSLDLSSDTQISPSSTHSKEFVTLSCGPGFQFDRQKYKDVSSLQIECFRDTWLDQDGNEVIVPKCQERMCGIPPSLINGYILNSTGSTPGEKALYKCSSGFQFDGGVEIKEAECGNDGKWTGTRNCRSASCDYLSQNTIINGGFKVVKGKDFTSQPSANQVDYNTVIEFFCDDGYEIIGWPTSHCRIDGWTHDGNTPTCKILQCPKIEIENAQGQSNVAVVDLSFGASQTVTCATGYAYNGNRQTLVMCLANQTYDVIPKCENINECTAESDNCDPATTECEDTEGSFTCNCLRGYERTLSERFCSDIDECERDSTVCHQNCQDRDGSYDCTCDAGYEIFDEEGKHGYYSSSRNGPDVIASGDIYVLNYTCVRVRCPPLTNPEHGRLLKGTLNKFQAGDSVKFRCNDGYQISTTLAMEETLTCRNNGEWDKEPTCNIKTCTVPNSPTNGEYDKSGTVNFGEQLSLNCTLSSTSQIYETRTAKCVDQGSRLEFGGDDITVCTVIDCGDPNDVKPDGSNNIVFSNTKHIEGASFSFSCQNQFELSGSSEEGSQSTRVQCKENGKWGFGSLKCTGRQCTDPGTPGDARQNVESYEVGQSLNYTCNNEGYKPVFENGDEFTSSTCTIDSNTGVYWPGLNPLPVCKDVTDPEITGCPTEPLYYYKNERVTMPNLAATDNAAVKSFISNDNLKTGDYIIADHFITYTATDYEGNTATCLVDIRAIDQTAEKPELNCPNYIEEDIKEDSRTINVTEVTGISSSNGVVTVVPASITVDVNKVGVSDKVTVTASRTIGTKTLTSTCTFRISYPKVTYCNKDQIYADPNRLSLESSEATSANSTCKPGYTYRDGKSYKVLTCNSASGWNYSPDDVFCLQYKNPTYAFDVSIKYSVDAISSTCISNFEVLLSQSLSTFRSKIAANSDCSSMAWNTNVKSAQATGYQFFETTISFELTNLGVPVNDRDGCRAVIAVTDSFFSLNGLNCPDNPSRTVTVSEMSAEPGVLGCIDESYTFLTTSQEFGQICIPCGPGTYYDQDTDSCRECPDNQYQSVANKYSCIDCPNEASATAVNIECNDVCPVGFYSISGMYPCTPCPVNTYWTNSKTCLACPDGGSTLGVEGVTQISGCYSPCSAGTFSFTGYAPCTSCPVSFFQSQNGQTMCNECSATQTTPNTATTTGTECVEITPGCTNDCNNNGVCRVDNHRSYCDCNAGYTGDSCETMRHICDTEPCNNGGSCEEGSDYLSYTCSCPVDVSKFSMVNVSLDQQGPGDGFAAALPVNSLSDCMQECLERDNCEEASYAELDFGTQCFIYSNTVILEDKASTTAAAVHMRKNRTTGNLFGGDNCEVDLINDCDDAGCHTESRCMDKINSFECLCPAGKEGELCTITANPCIPNPCGTHGRCDDFGVNYECTCQPGYTGLNCETNIMECDIHSNACLNGGTCVDEVNDYSCACATGYRGSYCEVGPDYCTGVNCLGDNVCFSSEYGQSTCYCDSDYFELDGAACSPTSTPCDNNDACGNNGTCKTTGIYNRYGFTCECDPGFTGSRCQSSIDDCVTKNCNNGRCVDGHQSSTCECNPGYSGDSCLDNINECDGVNCNDGQCEDLVNGYICNCNPGFTGVNCSTNIDECYSYPCQHGASCINGDNTYTCDCPDFWKGTNCDIPNNEFCSPNPCNGAACYSSTGTTDFFCICEGGSEGEQCEERRSTCSVLENEFDPCVNGICLDEGASAKCSCDTEYSAKKCSFGEGNADMQNNPSVPLLDSVFNPTSLADCQTRCLNREDCAAISLNAIQSCFLHGRANLSPVSSPGSTFYLRECPSHYSGDSCEFVKDWCSDENNPCGSHGNCFQSDPKGYICDCMDGYSGSQCDEYVDPCSSSPCGQISCHSEYDKYFCSCEEGKPYTNGACTEPSPYVMLVHNLEGTAEMPQLNTPFIINSPTMSLMMWFKLHSSSPSFKPLIMKGYDSFSPSDSDTPVIRVEVNEDAIIFIDGNMAYSIAFTEAFYNPDLYNEEWHLFGFAINEDGQFSCHLDSSTSRKTVELGDDFMLENVFFQIQLGDKVIAEFEKLTVWDKYLPPADFTLAWAGDFNPSFAPVQNWWNYNLPPSSVITSMRSDKTLKIDESKTPPTLDCASVGFDEPMKIVASEKYLSDIPDLVLNFNELKTKNNQLEYAMANLPEYFEWGLYNAVILGFNANERYGECRFPIYVKYNEECPKLIKHDSSVDTQECNGNNGVCSISCSGSSSSLSSPSPLQIPCGPLGVYNQMLPNYTLVLPTCTLFSNRKYIVDVKLVYSFIVDCANLASDIVTVERRIREDLYEANTKWSDLCDVITGQNDCSNVMFGRAECRPSEPKMLDVEFSIVFDNSVLTSATDASVSMNLEDAFINLIQDENQFDSMNNLGSAELVKDQVEVTTREGCDTPGYTLLTKVNGGTRQSICAPCGKGHYVNSDGICTKCRPGTYNDQENQSNCTSCPTNSTNYEFGEIAESSCINVCQPGEAYNGNNGCQDCARHRYQAESGKNFCDFCKYTFKTATTGSDSPDDCKEDCPAGMYRTVSQACEMCLRGYWRSPTDDDCQKCPDNKTTMLNELAASASDCSMDICGLGEYWSVEKSICVPCEEGSYQDELLALKCKQCDGNLTTDGVKKTSKDECIFYCSEGYEVLNADDRTCKACERGTYKTNDGSAKFGNCVSCPSQTTDGIASKLEADCSVPICEAGQIIVNGECGDCPLDTYSEVDEPYTTTECLACVDPSCSPGVQTCDLYGTMAIGSDNSTMCKRYCEAGKELINGECQMCKRGFYKDNDGDSRFEMCKPCSADSSMITDEEGADSIDKCNKPNCTAGQSIVVDEGGAYVCTDCDEDTYQELDSPVSSIECTACPSIGNTKQGTMSAKSTNEEDCNPICPEGQEYDMDGQRCVKCPISQYKEASDRFGKCKNCTEGYVASATGATAISDCTIRDCGPGTKIDGDQCEPCPVCTWQNQRRTTSCIECGINLCTLTTGAKSQSECTIKCEAGSEGTEVCNPCKDHFYKKTASFGPCIECEEGTTSSPDNRTACNLLYCHYGKELKTVGGTETCVDCKIGFYKNELGNQATCLQCPESYTTTEPGQRECNARKCLPGTTLNGTECDDCLEGTYKVDLGNMECTPCPSNFTTDGVGKTSRTQCNQAICPAGQYRNQQQPDLCLECAVNFYQPSTGSLSCTRCETGYITLETGSTTDEQCVPLCVEGVQYNSATKQCDPCQQGYYKQSIGNTDMCTKCQEGRTTVGTGSTSSSSCDQTLCDVGTYGVAENNRIVCYPCEIGYYNPNQGQSKCTQCPNGKTTFRNGRSDNADCFEPCQQGYGFAGRSKTCVECDVNQYNDAIEGKDPFYCKNCLPGYSALEKGSSDCTLEVPPVQPVIVNINLKIELVYKVGIQSCEPQYTSVLLGIIKKTLESVCQNEQSNRFRNGGSLCGIITTALAQVNPCTPARRKKRATFDLKVDATFNNVSSTVTNPDNSNVIDTEDAIAQMLIHNEEDLSPPGGTVVYQDYDPTSIRVTDVCSPGTQLVANVCEPCAAGTYWEDATCKECGTDTYQDETQQTSCKTCPALTYNDLPGQTSATACRSFCPTNPNYCTLRGACSTTGRRTATCACYDGYEGNQCQSKSEPSSDMDLILGLAIGGGGGLLLIILAIVGIYRYMSVKDQKKKYKQSHREGNMEHFHDTIYDNNQRKNYGLPHFQSVGYPALGYRPEPSVVEDQPYSTVYRNRPSANMDKSYDNDTFVWQA